MPTNPNWPLSVTHFSTSNAFDGSAQAYVRISDRIREFASSAGRQYELDSIEAGEARMIVDDKDEAFNPTNTSSAYYPNVKPYRQLVDQAMWPPQPNGAAVNLLNANVVPLSYDPTFEAYVVNATPWWVSAIDGSTPKVDNTLSFAGTNDLLIALTAGSTAQGAVITVPCIPGQQYTTSGYVRLSVANTVGIYLGATPGTTTTTVGSYVRVSITFTATQTTHRILFQTVGTVAAGDFRVDNVQHETALPLNDNPYFEVDATGWFAQGGTVARSTVQAHEGVASLLLTPSGSAATAEADANSVPVVAGSIYSASAWVYCAVARNVFITINWFLADGTYLSTATSVSVAVTANTWTPVSIAATAPGTAGKGASIIGMSSTPPASNLLYIDQAILSQTPTAFSTTGPVIYGVFAGFVERWPSSWIHQGTFGQAQITAVDALAALAVQQINTAFSTQVLATSPAFYWRLSTAATGTTFPDSSGNDGPGLIKYNSKYGIADATPGTAITIAGDPSGTGVLFTQGVAVGSSNTTGTILAAGPAVGTPQTKMGGTTGVGHGFSGACCVQVTIPRPVSRQDVLFGLANSVANSSFNSTFANKYTFTVSLNANGTVDFSETTTNGTNTVTSTARIDDGRPHFIAASLLDSVGTLTMNLYIDGQVAATGSFVVTSAARMVTDVEVGGYYDGTLFNAAVGATIAHMALWPLNLSASDVTALWNAGRGWPGESSGTRLRRFLVKWKGSPTSIDNGMSTMGVDATANKATALSACQAVSSTENGRFWADPNGTLTFRDRSAQYLNVTPLWVFGENESPYEGGILYDFDPTLVYNDVRVTRAGGSEQVGGTPAGIAASADAYGTRSYSRTINTLSDNEANDTADWIFATHSQPIQRVAALTIRPSANLSLWPVALGARIGDRVTVKRRTATFTMSSDYYIERIQHRRTSSEWTVTFQMSPVPPGTAQAWILGDSVRGVLDSTTVLAY